MQFTVLVLDSELHYFEKACKDMSALILSREEDKTPGLTWITITNISATGLISIGQNMIVDRMKTTKPAFAS